MLIFNIQYSYVKHYEQWHAIVYFNASGLNGKGPGYIVAMF